MDSILQQLLPQSFPISRQQGIVATTVVIGVVGLLYYWFISLAQDRAIPGFPIATLDDMGPKKAWLLRGQEVLAEGVRRVRAVAVLLYYPSLPLGSSGAC